MNSLTRLMKSTISIPDYSSQLVASFRSR